MLLLVSCSNEEVTQQPVNTNVPKDKKEVTLIFDKETILTKSIIEVYPEFIEFRNDSQIDFKKFEYLVSDQTDKAPNGFLRKIISTTVQGNKIIVYTKNATITEIAPTSDYSGIYNYDNGVPEIMKSDQGDIIEYNRETMNTKGSRTARAISFGTFTFNISRVIFDADGNPKTTYDQIKADGTIAIKPSLDFAVRNNWGKLEEYKNIITFENTGTLKLSWSLSHTLFERSIDLASYQLPPTTFFVGWIPVVVTHTVKISLDANGSVSTSITAGITGSMTLKTGIHYYNKKWNIIHEVKDIGYEILPLTAQARFDASLVLNAGFESKFYGLVGVGIKGGAGFYVEGSITGVFGPKPEAYIDWYIGARAELSAYATAGLFDIPGLTFNWNYPIWSQDFPLTEGRFPLL
tara:strand:- start:481 stop:1698 length:1218 start_codon:yes stop_codon:yes gene_type:complete